jgi:tetratricopeptide (TPR) repeat protein
MNCKEVAEQDIAERYLLDRLTEPERDEFEKHYFECESCFSPLQTGLAVQTKLLHQPLVLTQARGASWRRMWAWRPALAALVLLFGVGFWWYWAQKRPSSQQVFSSPPKANPKVFEQSQPPSSAAPSLEELARVEAPPYSATVLRGAEDEKQEGFRKAMQYYVKRDYLHAIPDMRIAVQASPQTSNYNFYLGACYLLTGQTDSAIVSLRKTISLGDPGYSESAHFYLAKAYLIKNEISAAEVELQTTIRLQGDHEAEARDILRQLRR